MNHFVRCSVLVFVVLLLAETSGEVGHDDVTGVAEAQAGDDVIAPRLEEDGIQRTGESENRHSDTLENSSDDVDTENLALHADFVETVSVESEGSEFVSHDVTTDGATTETEKDEGKGESSNGKSNQSVTSTRRVMTLREVVNSLFGIDDDQAQSPLDGAEEWGGNATLGNTTDAGSSNASQPKVECVVRNTTNLTVEEVQTRLVNATELLQLINDRENGSADCRVVLFYAPWCQFCARLAPHYNALGRAWPQLEVLALDAVQHNSLNTRFGTVAVPHVLVLHKGKAVARFSSETADLDTLSQFIANTTGLSPEPGVTLSPADYEGPVPTTAEEAMDVWSYVAWGFIVLVVIRGLGKRDWAGLARRFRPHQHVD